jgi:deoxycytidine triphosphate deaminase
MIPSRVPIGPHSDCAGSDEEAELRSAQARDCDPFPAIPPALLNSSDISDYVRTTGMIYPFHPGDLKSASYSARIKGKFIRFDDHGKRIVENINFGDKFTLSSNSISFASIEPKFRLPNYIALRFNLQIRNVHKGLLLGTGPLVDPGFKGHLLIPLHNLTTNDYEMVGGDELIWIEFTKTSPHPRWDTKAAELEAFYKLQGAFKEFNRPELTPEQYVERASPNRPIRSSIPEAMVESQRAVKAAADSAQQSKLDVESAKEKLDESNERVAQISIIALIVFVLTSAAVYFQINTVITDANKLAGTFRDDFATFRIKFDKFETEVGALKGKSLDDEIKAIRKDVEKLQQDLTMSAQRAGDQAAVRSEIGRLESRLDKIETQLSVGGASSPRRR